jgi:hypothetical protein
MENADFSDITVKEVMAFIIILAFVLLIGLLGGSITAENRMMRQSLEGYTTTANYKTNSVGEVTIQSMQWSKK